MEGATLDRTMIIVLLVMYAYGFSLMIWAIYFDKKPTPKSVKAAKWGLAGLIATLLYFFVMWIAGLEHFKW